MSQHEKHQYYFEKYLRDEMPMAERNAFDEKMAEDASLRLAFEYYRLNRQKLLKDLAEEHKLIRRDNRFNKLIFLLISLTGIALTFNYFVYRQGAGSDQTNAHQNKENIFVRYIPFLKRETGNEPKPNSLPTPSSASTKASVPKDSITPLEPSTNRDERLTSDGYQRDTFITLLDEAGANAWLTYWNKSDSLDIDSIVNLPPPNPKNHKSPIMLVEYWESPFGYKGYLLQQNTLVLYGVQEKNILIYKDQDDLYLVLPSKGRIPIHEQSNFTAF